MGKGAYDAGRVFRELQPEGRKRFVSREEARLRAKQRESNHCQEHFHSPAVRHLPSIKPQSLLLCSQDAPESGSRSWAPTELFACWGPV